MPSRFRKAAGRLAREERGAQTVEYLALGLLVLLVASVFMGAVNNNQTLGSKFTAAVGRMIEAASTPK